MMSNSDFLKEIGIVQTAESQISESIEKENRSVQKIVTCQKTTQKFHNEAKF